MGCQKLAYREENESLKMVYNAVKISEKGCAGVYRYGFQGQERDDEISGSGNHTTAMFWEYDTRLGRRWNQDPRPNPSISNYATFSNNPIFYSDVFGDTVRGVNATSATRMGDEIQNTFTGDDAADLRNLFTLGSDGLTMSSISEDDFTSAVANLSEDQQQLAYGYYSAINSTDVHTVEMVKRSETLSSTSQGLFGKTTGAGLDDLTYGGVNTKTSATSTFSVVIMDNAKHVGDYVNSSGSSFFRSSLPGEVLAHEMLGHGVGTLRGSATAHYQDAIQMTNLYLRTQGASRYRSGAWHGKNPGETVLTKATATSVPSFIQIPAAMQMNIEFKKPIQFEPFIMPQDNTRVDPSYLGLPPR